MKPEGPLTMNPLSLEATEFVITLQKSHYIKFGEIFIFILCLIHLSYLTFYVLF